MCAYTLFAVPSPVAALSALQLELCSLWEPSAPASDFRKGSHSSPPGLVRKPSGSCPLRVVPSCVPGSHTAGRVCKCVYANGMEKGRSLPGIAKTRYSKGQTNDPPASEMKNRNKHLVSFFKTWNHTNGVHFSKPVRAVAKDTATGHAHQAGFCMHTASIFWSPCYRNKMNGFLTKHAGS